METIDPCTSKVERVLGTDLASAKTVNKANPLPKSDETVSQERWRVFLGKKRPCLICGSNFKEHWAKNGIFEAVQCPRCSFVWIDPFLSDEGLAKFYSEHYFIDHENPEDADKRDRMYEIDRDFLEEVIPGGKLLDVGCGGGFFLMKFSQKWEKCGIEFDDKAASHGRQAFGMDIRTGTFSSSCFPASYFDCVMMRGAIEHVPDPKTYVAEAARVLKPGGFLYITATPNVDSFSARIYREKWNQFKPLEHIYYFSPKTLDLLVGAFGFVRVKSGFHYLETPYADIEKDHLRVSEDFQKIQQGRRGEVATSPAFWGNMLSLIWKKNGRKMEDKI